MKSVNGRRLKQPLKQNIRLVKQERLYLVTLKYRHTEQPNYYKLLMAFQKLAQIKTNALITTGYKRDFRINNTNSTPRRSISGFITIRPVF